MFLVCPAFRRIMPLRAHRIASKRPLLCTADGGDGGETVIKGEIRREEKRCVFIEEGENWARAAFYVKG